MQVIHNFPLANEIILSFKHALGPDFIAYRNHVHRILNFYLALNGSTEQLPEAVEIAAAFHDLGIWTDGTFDYLAPSVVQASRYLASHNQEYLTGEVAALITSHHKITRYQAAHRQSVEPFRQADFVDVSLGIMKFGLPASFIRSVKERFPNQGFHWRLVKLTLRQLLRTPLRPLPMFRW